MVILSRAILLLFPAMLIMGCLGDEITMPEVQPRLILRPEQAWLEAVTGTSSIKAKWMPSPSDTQSNFKGYYIELYESAKFFDQLEGQEDSLFEPPLAIASVPRSDTSYIFDGVTNGKRYSIRVWGERYPNPDTPNVKVLSRDFANASLDFDPTPVISPPVLEANASEQLRINLRWTTSPSFSQAGFIGYRIGYRDNTTTGSLVYHTPVLSKFATSFSVQIQSTSPTGEIRPYLFWIKAIRNDSTESADSTLLVWSGAYAVPQGGIDRDIHPGMGLFIGQTNFAYDLVETEVSRSVISVDTAGGLIRLRGESGTKFAARIDTIKQRTLDSIYYTQPFDDSVFTLTELSIPNVVISGDPVIYALFDGGRRARIHLRVDVTSNSLLWNTTGTLKVKARYQIPGSYGLRYW